MTDIKDFIQIWMEIIYHWWMYWIWNRGGTMLHLCMFPLKWTWKRYNRNNYSVCSCLCLHSQQSTIPIFRCFIRAAFVVLSAICCLYLKACSTGLKSGECYGYLRTLHFFVFRSSWVSLQYVLSQYPSVDHFSFAAFDWIPWKNKTKAISLYTSEFARLLLIIKILHWPSSTGTHACLCHQIGSTILDRWCCMLRS